jgi:di- and tripeptidase
VCPPPPPIPPDTVLTHKNLCTGSGSADKPRGKGLTPGVCCVSWAECWRCAKFLTALLERLGASVKMVGLVEGRSPVVLARFGSDPSKATVTFYGHYDVVPATELTWKSEPFNMRAVNGYLYGRGVTDNKGPIMAMIFALKELSEAGRLDFNAVLLIEGEEENNSEGFRETVLQNLHWFRGTSLILQANSTWISDDRWVGRAEFWKGWICRSDLL